MHVGLHHLHIRKRLALRQSKRIYRELKAFPHPTFWKRMLDYIMYVVAIGSPLALLPQVIHVFRLRDAGGLSWESFSLFFIINLLWLVYALAHREMPLAIASICFAMLDVVLVYGILLYS